MRSRQVVMRNNEHYRTLSSTQGGTLILILWVNSVIFTAQYGVLAVVIGRAVHRSWRNRRLGPIGALRAGPRMSLVWAVGGLVLQGRVLRWWALPALERRGLWIGSDPASVPPPSS